MYQPIGVCQLRLRQVSRAHRPQQPSLPTHRPQPSGYEPLRARLHALTLAQQRPQGAVQVNVTCGSTYGLDVVLDLLLERGDPLLLEEYTYSHALEAQLMPKGWARGRPSCFAGQGAAVVGWGAASRGDLPGAGWCAWRSSRPGAYVRRAHYAVQSPSPLCPPNVADSPSCPCSSAPTPQL